MKNVGPNIEAIIDHAKINKIILSPMIYRVENYFIATEDSTIVSAAKRLGYSTINCLIVGEEREAEIEIQRIIRKHVNESNYGTKHITKTILQLESSWARLFAGTSYKDKFYEVVADAVKLPKEVVERAIKTREPTGITKEDLSKKIAEIRDCISHVQKVEKISDVFCPHCGNIEKMNTGETDARLIPHYVHAAVVTKVNHLISQIPFSSRESTLKLIRDGIQRLIAKQTRVKTRDKKDEDSW